MPPGGFKCNFEGNRKKNYLKSFDLFCEKRIILFYIVHNLMDVYLSYFWITPYMLNYQRFAIWDERNRELNAL